MFATLLCPIVWPIRTRSPLDALLNLVFVPEIDLVARIEKLLMPYEIQPNR